ncbi:MAG: hypothetical protein ACHQ03_10095 [Candidatus Bathyarchaeia archaeon]
MLLFSVLFAIGGLNFHPVIAQSGILVTVNGTIRQVTLTPAVTYSETTVTSPLWTQTQTLYGETTSTGLPYLTSTVTGIVATYTTTTFTTTYWNGPYVSQIATSTVTSTEQQIYENQISSTATVAPLQIFILTEGSGVFGACVDGYILETTDTSVQQTIASNVGQSVSVTGYSTSYSGEYSQYNVGSLYCENVYILTVTEFGQSTQVQQTVTTTFLQSGTTMTATTTGSGFPSPPQTPSDIPGFLSAFWAWVACHFFGRCSSNG